LIEDGKKAHEIHSCKSCKKVTLQQFDKKYNSKYTLHSSGSDSDFLNKGERLFDTETGALAHRLIVLFR